MSETGKVQVNEFEQDMDFTPQQQETLQRIIGYNMDKDKLLVHLTKLEDKYLREDDAGALTCLYVIRQAILDGKYE